MQTPSLGRWKETALGWSQWIQTGTFNMVYVAKDRATSSIHGLSAHQNEHTGTVKVNKTIAFLTELWWGAADNDEKVKELFLTWMLTRIYDACLGRSLLIPTDGDRKKPRYLSNSSHSLVDTYIIILIIDTPMLRELFGQIHSHCFGEGGFSDCREGLWGRLTPPYSPLGTLQILDHVYTILTHTHTTAKQNIISNKVVSAQLNYFSPGNEFLQIRDVWNDECSESLQHCFQ